MEKGKVKRIMGKVGRGRKKGRGKRKRERGMGKGKEEGINRKMGWTKG